MQAFLETVERSTVSIAGFLSWFPEPQVESEDCEQSLHRALRRVEGLNLVTQSLEPVAGTGAKRKMYELTASGERVLADYLQDRCFI